MIKYSIFLVTEALHPSIWVRGVLALSPLFPRSWPRFGSYFTSHILGQALDHDLHVNLDVIIDVAESAVAQSA